MELREAEACRPMTEAELVEWEADARGPKEWTGEHILRLIAEVRRARTAANPDTVIIRDPERCAGAPTVVGTRTAVHDIVAYAKRYDWDLARVQADELPHLSLSQLSAAVEYYHAHEEEIEEILRRRQEHYEGGVARPRASR